MLEESKIRNLIKQHIKLIDEDLTFLDNSGLYKEIESILKNQQRSRGQWRNLSRIEFNNRQRMMNFNNKSDQKKKKRMSKYENLGFSKTSVKYLDKMMDVRNSVKYKSSMMSLGDITPPNKNKNEMKSMNKLTPSELKEMAGYASPEKKINFGFGKGVPSIQIKAKYERGKGRIVMVSGNGSLPRTPKSDRDRIPRTPMVGSRNQPVGIRGKFKT